MKTVEDIFKFQNINKLKFTYRFWERLLDGKRESVADHTRACQIVAEYLLQKLEQLCPWKYILDKLRILEMIIYHDLIEAETGDIDNHPSSEPKRINKEHNEKEKLPLYIKKIPDEVAHSYLFNLEEYEKRESLESKFVKLVDVVEWQFQAFCYKNVFDERTKTYRCTKFEKHFDWFPELKYIYEEMLKYYEENKYFLEE